MLDATTKRMVADIPIFAYETVDSTQNIAQSLIDSGMIQDCSNDMGLLGVVTAQHQTQGKGRRNRFWQSKKNSSYIWTFIFQKNDLNEIHKVMLLTVSIIGLIRQHLNGSSNKQKGEVKLKWPNDLIVADGEAYRKLGGVLSEVVDNFLLVGVGINLNSDFFDERTKEIAVALDEFESAEFKSDFVDEVVSTLLMSNTSTVVSDYKVYMDTLGKQVRVDQASGSITGTAIEVSEDGALMIEKENDEIQSVYEGDVVHLRNI